MASFGKESQRLFEELCPELQLVLGTAIKYVDFSITCGHRGQTEQDKAFAEGKSQVKFPDGKHNKIPSDAVDVIPYPPDYKDVMASYLLAGVLLGVANSLGVRLRLGADWDGDFDTIEHTLKDPYHVEVIR